MRILARGGAALALVAVGYFLGNTGALDFQPAQAQPGADPTLGKETKEKIKTAYDALNAAEVALKNDGKYTSATDGVNPFAALAGGLNAQSDLETGAGVDPHTFAALYADRAIPTVREHLGHDAQGRLTYKNKVVRMYPIARLKQFFAARDGLAGIEK